MWRRRWSGPWNIASRGADGGDVDPDWSDARSSSRFAVRLPAPLYPSTHKPLPSAAAGTLRSWMP